MSNFLLLPGLRVQSIKRDSDVFLLQSNQCSTTQSWPPQRLADLRLTQKFTKSFLHQFLVGAEDAGK